MIHTVASRSSLHCLFLSMIAGFMRLSSCARVGRIEQCEDCCMWCAIHALILKARSPVFKAMLDAPMKEGLSQKIEIEGLRESSVAQMLHFMNTDQVELLYLTPPEEGTRCVLTVLEADCFTSRSKARVPCQKVRSSSPCASSSASALNAFSNTVMNRFE